MEWKLTARKPGLRVLETDQLDQEYQDYQVPKCGVRESQRYDKRVSKMALKLWRGPQPH